jgi:hypothetical protein
MVRIGDRKIVRLHAEPWELYDPANDPTELDDLARERPDERAEMEAATTAGSASRRRRCPSWTRSNPPGSGRLPCGMAPYEPFHEGGS